MDAAKSVTAVFSPVSSGPVAITLEFAGINGGSGDVIADANGDVCTWSGTGPGTGTCAWTVPNAGTYFRLIAMPREDGSIFAGWTGATCDGFDQTSSVCDVVPGPGPTTTITANFRKP
jgi:hypothetical protein